jgi:hypothetical protein
MDKEATMKALSQFAGAVAILLSFGCGSKIPISSNPPTPSRVHDYQRLFDTLGDRCYPGDQFPVETSGTRLGSPQDLSKEAFPISLRASFGFRENSESDSELSSGFHYLPVSMVQSVSQSAPDKAGAKKRAISSVEDLALLSDIEFAKYKDNDLILVGPPAAEGQGFRPDDWYTVFRAIASDEAPGVSIDPGPDPRHMQVRYFGGIQQTALGNTFFEADRTLKILSTGFDNLTCNVWTGRPHGFATELDFIAAEMGQSAALLEGERGWHRFWFEPSDEPIETESLTMRMPRNRLVVKDEPIPPGRPSPNSARQFASALTANFLGMTQGILQFRQLQQDAALVSLAKWMRDKQIPADEDWVGGQPKKELTATSTPSITVLRSQLIDDIYLRFGIHGGVDFQRENRYGNASTQSARLSTAVDQSGTHGLPTWQFAVDGQLYQAVRLRVSNPVQLASRWIIWQRITTVLVQPKPYRLVVPRSNLVVTNETSGPLTIYVAGPVTKTETVSVGTPSSIRVVPGFYRLRVESANCGTKDDSVTVREGERHELRYLCPSGTIATGRPAFFTVINNTYGSLTLQMTGALNKTEYIPTVGQSSVQVVAGTYHLRIISRCGTKEDTVSVGEGDRHELRYWCEAPSAPAQVASGSFVVNNGTGATISVTVGGSTYSVAPGTSTIRLAPGFYTATITSVCGTATESLNLSNGTTYTGQYSCVSR